VPISCYLRNCKALWSRVYRTSRFTFLKQNVSIAFYFTRNDNVVYGCVLRPSLGAVRTDRQTDTRLYVVRRCAWQMEATLQQQTLAVKQHAMPAIRLASIAPTDRPTDRPTECVLLTPLTSASWLSVGPSRPAQLMYEQSAVPPLLYTSDN